MSDKTNLEPDPHANFHSGKEIIESEEVAALRKSLEEAQSEAKSNWEKLLRKEAELQNVQRRASIDVENARKFGVERLAQELLAVLDSFEQGLRFEESEIKNGMQLTYAMLLEVLAKFGIKEINPAVADAFNPQYHEAISIQDNKEMGANKIIAVVQKGYFIHDRVLRAARVIVSKVPTETESS
jgi:molecular chaperone GrpE